MKRSIIAICLVALFPLITVISLFILAKKLQPTVLSIASEKGYFDTAYFDESKYYALSGAFTCFPGASIVPSKYTRPATAERFEQSPVYLAREHTACTTISSLDQIQSKEYLSDGKYTATIGFLLKLPSNTAYGIWFPANLSEYKVYVNGVLASETKTFRSKNPNYPQSFLVMLPPTEDGNYEIVADLIAPKNYSNKGSNAILIGSYDRISRSFNNVKSTSLFLCTYITFTILFIMIQMIALRKDKRMFPFILLTLSTGLVMSFSDGRSILSVFRRLPYNVGFLLDSVAVPLFLASLLFFTYRMFSEFFPKKTSLGALILLTIPLINALTLKAFPSLRKISSLVEIIPYIICIYVFVRSYEAKLPHAFTYGISLLTILTSVTLYYLTQDMLIPSRFSYSVGYIILSIMMVSILACEYEVQNANEQFYSGELSRQLEAMQASENAFLNAQMKPHFLYNTLNTIADCCVTDSKKAQKLINSLSEYLKLIISLDNMDKTVPLRRELELVEAYTAIEKERFPSINFYNEFPIRMPRVMMPPITIQPLIENAIKHGVRKSDKPGVVTLRITESAEYVNFYVSDNGIGMEQETIDKLFLLPKENKSIGIYNIDKRLKNQYSEGLHVESTPGLGTCISFRIPKNM